jgi:hypothetical protein
VVAAGEGDEPGSAPRSRSAARAVASPRLRLLSGFKWRLLPAIVAVALLVLPSIESNAQIGGRSAADGLFPLDDAEDLNLTSEALGRDWISDFVFPSGAVLSVEAIPGSLAPAPGQSPIGALKATVPDDGFGSFNAGFGIPMPAAVGASTLDSPGNIASFSQLKFFARFSKNTATAVDFQVLLECHPQNPDSTFPTILWKYVPPEGATFSEITIDLRAPDALLNNPNNLTVDRLLSRARFLYFYFFANPVTPTAQLDFHVDDIRLVPVPIRSGFLAGATGASDDFTIDDVEDRDLTADPVGRDWIPDFVAGNPILTAVDLAVSGLTPASSQSPAGALRASVPEDFGSIDAGFGLPLPGAAGASTLDAPGDLTSFDHLRFLAVVEPANFTNPAFSLLLECYPQNSDGGFPTLLWNFTPPVGQTFGPIVIDLRAPDGVLRNPGDLPVEELLARTRFLFFSFFDGAVAPGVTMNFHLDDLRATVGDEPSPTPTPTPLHAGVSWIRYR